MKTLPIKKSPPGEGVIELKALSLIENNVKVKDSKERLSILKKELFSLEKALSECIYEEPKKCLEVQKVKTLQALASNSVYLNPKWVVDHRAFLFTAFMASPLSVEILTGAPQRALIEVKVADVVKKFVEPLISTSGIMLSKREATFLEKIIALPGYKFVKDQCSLSTELDFIKKTTVFCKKLVRENKEVITYIDRYNIYMKDLNKALEQNSQAFKSLGKDLEISLQKSEIMKDDEEAMACISKCLSLKYEEEDDEVSAILKKSESLSIEYELSHQLVQYSSLKKEILESKNEENTQKRKVNTDSCREVYRDTLLTASGKEGTYVRINNSTNSADSSCSLSSTPS